MKQLHDAINRVSALGKVAEKFDLPTVRQEAQLILGLLEDVQQQLAGKDAWIRLLWDLAFPQELLEDVLALDSDLRRQFERVVIARDSALLSKRDSVGVQERR